MVLRSSIIILLFIVLAGCVSGGVQRVDVMTETRASDTQTSSADFEVVTSKMVRSLMGLPALSELGHKPRIAFMSVENRSNEYLDTDAFLEKIRTLLIRQCQGSILFLDRGHVRQLLEERSAKQQGVFEGDTDRNLLGADFFLTGVVSTIDKAAGGVRSTYTRYSFRLVDAQSSAVVWEDDYEVKKVKKQRMWDY